jgi:hypothetical protein
MKAKHIFIFALLAFLTINTIAAEKAEGIDFDDKPQANKRLTEDRIDRMLERIAKNNPEEAERLEKMREENPDMFMKKLHERIMQGPKRRGSKNSDRRSEGSKGKGMHEEPRDGDGPRGERFAQMEKKKEEYLKWLQENYPDEFTRLQELKEEKPELYFRQMMVSGKKFGRIFEASKSNPELTEILKEDMALKQKRQELIKQISTANDEEKAELTKQLEAAVGQRFDLILKRKQIAYDKLRQRLEKLKEEVKTSQDEVEKWKDTKDGKVQKRITELLKKAESFNWE